MRSSQKAAARHPSVRPPARVLEGPLFWGALTLPSVQRFKPQAIDLRVNIEPVHCLLASPRDKRPRSYLQDGATDFQLLRLPLDWTIVTRDAESRWSDDDWSCHRLMIFVPPRGALDCAQRSQRIQRSPPHPCAVSLSLAATSKQVES